MIKLIKCRTKVQGKKAGYQTRIKPTYSFARVDKGTFSCFFCVIISSPLPLPPHWTVHNIFKHLMILFLTSCQSFPKPNLPVSLFFI